MNPPIWDFLDVGLVPPGFDPGGFRCRHQDLTDYLVDGSAERDQQTNFSTTYLVTDRRDGALIGYFSVLSDAIRLQQKERPKGVTYGSGPAIKLGRMGVDLRYNGPENNCGGFIIRWVIGLARDISRQMGVRYVTLDALAAPNLVAWYERNGFVRNEGVRVTTKILREALSRIKQDQALSHVSMRYDILLEEEVPR